MTKAELQEELKGWKSLYKLERAENEKLKKELEENYKYSTLAVNLNARLKEEISCYEYYFEHREKVVHCKDCKYDGLHTCPIAYIENQTLQFVNHSPDFWCAKGELKESEP
jgi:hypothetical protein